MTLPFATPPTLPTSPPFTQAGSGPLSFLRFATQNVVNASPELQRTGEAIARLQRMGSRRHRAALPQQPPPAASTPSPYAQPDLWNTLYLGGALFLGIATIDGKAGVKIDVAKGSGRDGGTIRDKGYELAKVKLKLLLWDEECWASWDGMLPVIDPRRQVGRRTPVDASHPALAQRGITRLYIQDIGFPKVGEDGTVTVDIEAIEFHPPTARPGTSHRAAAPTIDLATNRTAFTGLRAPPPGPAAPSTTTAIGPD